MEIGIPKGRKRVRRRQQSLRKKNEREECESQEVPGKFPSKIEKRLLEIVVAFG